MNELVNLVQQKTGISQSEAQTAVTTVLNYLKQHLPQPVASQLDNFMGGQGGQAGNIASDIGGMFNKGGGSNTGTKA